VLLVVLSASLQKAKGFGASYALVVGIDNYQNPRWPALTNGKSDAMAAIEFLKSQNDQVTALLDGEATRANILSYFRTYLREKLKGNDRFLFFFNGHGYTEKYGDQEIGYIVPVDGDSSPSLISMEEIRQEAALLDGAKHQLLYSIPVSGIAWVTNSPQRCGSIQTQLPCPDNKTGRAPIHHCGRG
jgi:uncharacterized caspase-like protein